jgi:hypothetical protein
LSPLFMAETSAALMSSRIMAALLVLRESGQHSRAERFLID